MSFITKVRSRIQGMIAFTGAGSVLNGVNYGNLSTLTRLCLQLHFIFLVAHDPMHGQCHEAGGHAPYIHCYPRKDTRMPHPDDSPREVYQLLNLVLKFVTRIGHETEGFLRNPWMWIPHACIHASYTEGSVAQSEECFIFFKIVCTLNKKSSQI